MKSATSTRLHTRGIIAFGGLAIGIFAIGGGALGLFTFGGLSIGLIFSYGGVAAGAMAFGGFAAGYVATGGLATGYYAMGGAAYGVHAFGSNVHDPVAQNLFKSLSFLLQPTFLAVAMGLLGIGQVVHFGAFFWVRSREKRQKLNAPRPHAANPGKPRLSRKAIAGALWSAFFLAVPLLWLTFATSPRGTSHGPSSILQIVLWLLAAIGLTAPVATTAFGVAAISEIRHSAGGIIGLPLALADALLFPLLLLDALIMACCGLLVGIVLSFAARVLGNGPGGLGAFELLLLGGFGLVIALPLDFWIVRRAWRAASKPLSAGSSAPPR